MSDIYVYIGGAKTSLLSLAASSGISYATIMARYKAGVAPESLTAGAKAVLDTVPTDGSTNGITSGAVFTAVQSLASDISGLDTDKIDKVSGATAGHAAIMTAAGGVADAGFAPTGMTLLWENASITSNFVAQTISLANGNYDFLVIFTRFDTGANDVNGAIGIKGTPIHAQIVGSGNYGWRSFRFASDTSLTVTDCTYGQIISNNHMIPIKIYGIKVA